MLRNALLVCAATVAGTVCTSIPASGISGGIVPDCGDRRFDCVGFLRSAAPDDCANGNSVRGSCVLISKGARAANGTLIEGAKVICAAHSIGIQFCDAASFPNFKIRFRRSADGEVNGYFGGQSVCDGNYQELNVVRIECAPPELGLIDQMILVLDDAVTHIEPAIVDLTSPLLEFSTGYVAGWGENELGEKWMLRYSPTPVARARLGSTTIRAAGGLLHDSGAGIFIEVPPSRYTDSTLRLVGVLQSTLGGHDLSTWKDELAANQNNALPPPLASDYNEDGVVNVFDYFDYINAWIERSCLADLDESGTVEVNDLFIYSNFFIARQ